jgi:hypothetical protein
MLPDASLKILRKAPNGKTAFCEELDWHILISFLMTIALKDGNKSSTILFKLTIMSIESKTYAD